MRLRAFQTPKFHTIIAPKLSENRIQDEEKKKGPNQRNRTMGKPLNGLKPEKKKRLVLLDLESHITFILYAAI